MKINELANLHSIEAGDLISVAHAAGSRWAQVSLPEPSRITPESYDASLGQVADICLATIRALDKEPNACLVEMFGEAHEDLEAWLDFLVPPLEGNGAVSARAWWKMTVENLAQEMAVIDSHVDAGEVPALDLQLIALATEGLAACIMASHHGSSLAGIRGT